LVVWPFNDDPLERAALYVDGDFDAFPLEPMLETPDDSTSFLLEEGNCCTKEAKEEPNGADSPTDEDWAVFV